MKRRPKVPGIAFEDFAKKCAAQAEADRHAEDEQRRAIEPSRERRRKKPLPSDPKHWSGVDWSWWWRKHGQRSSFEEDRAAMLFEAIRRHPEVREAYRNGMPATAMPWQPFTVLVLAWFPKAWPELDESVRRTLIQLSLDPLFKPPRGFTFYPRDRQAQMRASVRVLRLPSKEDPEAAMQFLRTAKRFVEAGFIIAAVDNKTKDAVMHAFTAIKHMPRSPRAADLVLKKLAPQEDVVHGQFGEWKATQGFQVVTINKRLAKGRKMLIEERNFNFRSICAEFEELDRSAKASDFISRLIL